MTHAGRCGIIERLLRARGSGSVGFGQLQERPGVSRATLFRDLRNLHDRMRVPIVRHGKSGGCRIGKPASWPAAATNYPCRTATIPSG